MAELIIPTEKRQRARRIVGTIEQRFWPKVDKTLGHGPWGDCWIWTATLFRGGYGKFSVATSVCDFAHRVSWRMANGEIAGGLNVLHKCDNRPCVRDSHLFLGTNDDNIADMMSKKRNQHKLTEEQVREIWEMAKTESQTYVALKFGINQTMVGFIVRREEWKHLDLR